MTSLDEHNPYAAPEAELQVPSASARPAAFYAMSPRKAVVMTMLTLGFYDLVFWYRHWKRLKDNGYDFSPFFRAFFAGFTSFRFVSILRTARVERDLPSGEGLRASAGIYLGLNIASRISERILEGVPYLVLTVLACAGCAWVLATVQHAANEVLEADGSQGQSNSGVTAGAIFGAALGLAIWAFMIIDAVNPELLEE